ncbi:unnamed protein product, partial [Prorocentrum cordatum]
EWTWGGAPLRGLAANKTKTVEESASGKDPRDTPRTMTKMRCPAGQPEEYGVRNGLPCWLDSDCCSAACIVNLCAQQLDVGEVEANAPDTYTPGEPGSEGAQCRIDSDCQSGRCQLYLCSAPVT